MRTQSGNQVHRTTREMPFTLFANVEKSLLTALPDVPPQLASWTMVKARGDAMSGSTTTITRRLSR